MYQIILTIIAAFGAFCAFYLLGSSRQKDKDDKTLREYKTETEAVIRATNQKAADAQAEKNKAVIEKNLMKQVLDIVSSNVESDDEELEEMAENAETDEECADVLKAMQADSQRRAEELEKRYEH